MKTRILTAAVLLAIFVPILWFSHLIVYPIAMAILAGVAVLELLRCLKLHTDLPVSVGAVTLAVALTLLARFSTGAKQYLGAVAVAFFVFTLYLFAVAVFRAGALRYGSLMGVVGGTLYLTIAFSSMVLLRDLPNGVFLFLLPFIGSWVTDTFAYFTGRLIGRHKLAPVISPKKTVEGSIGGIVFAVGAFAAYGAIVAARGVVPSYPALLLCGLVVSVVSQIGDLALSAIKREYDIKDYGRIFPGHGGVLDRFDSVIATAPLILLFSLLESGLMLFH